MTGGRPPVTPVKKKRRTWSFQMDALDHAHLRWLDDQYRGRLTVAGRAVFWGTVAACVLLLGGISAGLARTAGIFLALCAVSTLSRSPPASALQARRRLPPPPVTGEIWRYTVEIENTGATPLYDLHIEERGLPAMLRPAGEPPVLARLDPGARATVHMQLLARRRGRCTLSRLQIANAGPLGLIKSGLQIGTPDRFLVYPKVTPVPALDLPAAPAPQPGGIPVAARVGESAEFLSLRPWRPGDRLRDVDWRALARTGRAVSREYQQEYFIRLALVVDVSSPSLAEDHRVETALSLAAGVTDHLARQDFIIDIFAAGDGILRLQAGLGLDHLDNILEQMAAIEPGAELDTEQIAAVIGEEAQRLSAVIFIFTGWDQRRAELVERVRGMGVEVVRLGEP